MSGRLELWLFAAQRLTAMILAPLVLLHLAVMIYAVQDGLSAAEILGRTRGSVFWGGVYGLFVLAAAVHGAIGLRVVMREMTAWRGAVPNIVAALFCVAVLALGIRAVGAIT
ncbi:MAG: succinate dehydrogenase [Alphaproteobacteria bacterium]